jgi:hypothetical protein
LRAPRLSFAGHGRSEAIDARQFAACIDAVAGSEAAGLCVFTMADLLGMRASADGRSRLVSLAGFRM